MEDRRLLAVTASLDAGVLTISSDAADDSITLLEDGANLVVHSSADGGLIATYSPSSVAKLEIEGGEGHDVVNLNAALSLDTFSVIADEINVNAAFAATSGSLAEGVINISGYLVN